MSNAQKIFTDLVLIRPVESDQAGIPVKIDPAERLLLTQKKFSSLLPVANIELTEAESQTISTYQQARLILGAAGASPMVCAANCPVIDTCPLAQIKKAPFNQLCPFEANYVTERFMAWMQEIGVTEDSMLESERSALSSLVYLDLQEQRCNKLLARAQNASLISRSVRDVDEEGEAIAWEDVIHINAQRLDQIITQRRMILKDFELTPEQKTRKKKALGIRAGDDLSNRQSDLRDKVNKAIRAKVVDAK